VRNPTKALNNAPESNTAPRSCSVELNERRIQVCKCFASIVLPVGNPKDCVNGSLRGGLLWTDHQETQSRRHDGRKVHFLAFGSRVVSVFTQVTAHLRQ
jgi:hypothetical protein